MANTLFMPEGGNLIEIVSDLNIDSRHLPLLGIFPRLASVVGLHHFLLLSAWKGLSTGNKGSISINETDVFLQLKKFAHLKTVSTSR